VATRSGGAIESTTAGAAKRESPCGVRKKKKQKTAAEERITRMTYRTDGPSREGRTASVEEKNELRKTVEEGIFDAKREIRANLGKQRSRRLRAHGVQWGGGKGEGREQFPI